MLEYKVRTGPEPRVGWLCSYTPVEIIAAAGFRPLRLPGESGHEARATTVLPAALCPYLKSCLGAALDGASGPLAGLIVVAGCDGLRRLADVWARYGPGFVHVLDVPRQRNAAAASYLRSQFLLLAGRLERAAGQELSEDALRAAIAERNCTRRLLAELDERRQAGLALPVGEMLSLVDLSSEEAPAVCNPQLAARLNRPTADGTATGVPVVLSGNIVARPDRALTDLIEAAGARVVGDDLCSGVRGAVGEAAEGGDPFLSLARRYLERPPCPRMADAEERFEDVAHLCRRTGAHGVIYLSQKYCDAALYDLAPLRTRLEQAGVRVLHLELDADVAMPGQMRTRIEAFLEVL